MCPGELIHTDATSRGHAMGPLNVDSQLASTTYQHAGPQVLVDFVLVRGRTIATLALEEGID